MLDDLFERFRQRDRRSLARLVSLAARGELAAEIGVRLPAPSSPSRVVAFTGSGGVGKSSLVGKLTELARRQGSSVAVLASDPQSSLTGGALLGDRFRMGSPTDDGIFIRSLAATQGHGAIAERLDLLVRIVESFGFDVVFLETVGAGQGDVAVRAVADVVVLLLQPETGDDIQWEKAGVLEVADVIVVHKADLPGAEQTAAQVRAEVRVPVVLASSRTGNGLDSLWQTIAALPLRRTIESAAEWELFRLAQETLAHRFEEVRNEPEVQALVTTWRRGDMSSEQAIEVLLALLAEAD